MKTIKQLADEIGVTKAALQKRMGRGGLYSRLSPHISTKAGTKYIDEQGEIIIKQSFEEKPFINSTDTPIDGDMVTGIDGNTRDISSEIDNSLIELLREQAADLRNQLAIKDKQIEDLNLRLAESNAALVSAQQTVQAEQALHAGTIQSRLIAEKSQDEEPLPKSGLWSKLFKRKN